MQVSKIRNPRVERGEIYSFLLIAAVMVAAAVVFLPLFWLFILFALIDGTATLLRVGLAVSLNRIAFGFVLLLLSSLTFSVVSIVLETIFLIALLDTSFLLRQVMQHTTRDLIAVLSSRFNSYLYTLVPAGVFSLGILYLASPPFSSGVPPDFAITLLGVSSVAAFLVILFLV